MNLIDIVKNAPEGATHYQTFYIVGDLVEYYKVFKGQSMFFSNRDKRWKLGSGFPRGCSNLTPLPKLKTEYRKVEDKHSITIEQFEYEGVNFYLRRADCGQYVEINRFTLYEKLRDNKPIYRRIETIIDEREEFKRRMSSARQEWAKNDNTLLNDFLFDKGCRFID